MKEGMAKNLEAEGINLQVLGTEADLSINPNVERCKWHAIVAEMDVNSGMKPSLRQEGDDIEGFENTKNVVMETEH